MESPNPWCWFLLRLGERVNTVERSNKRLKMGLDRSVCLPLTRRQKRHWPIHFVMVGKNNTKNGRFWVGHKQRFVA